MKTSIFSQLGVVLALVSLFVSLVVPLSLRAETTPVTTEPTVYMFGREDCGFCNAQEAWLQEEGIAFTYLNIVEDETAKEQYDQVTRKHDISKVTPVTVIGESVLVGFNSPETTGQSIIRAIEQAKRSDIDSIEAHLERAPVQDVIVGGGCSGVACETGGETPVVFDLPLLGLVDLRSFSLFTLSAVLGVIDGFNPCAMWVLITFLMLLMQAGSRKKMIVMAGIFILAEGVMYNLILNVWYKTWDFVSLDQIVTPLVGLLAVGGGGFFLYRWYRNRGVSLVCDISGVDQQMKTVGRLKKVITAPLTLGTLAAILLIAFSVNIIEFACSIGIPQAYTKILELNGLSFLERQWYILVYTLGYMVDDLVVFGLAIWGFAKLEAHGQKYSQLSLLIGGVLMLLLGVILVFNPNLLVL